MKLNFWMGTKAVVEAFFGIGFVLMPVPLGSMFGFKLSPPGVLMAQLCGAVFIFSSIVLWRARNESPAHPILQAIVTATVMSNGIGLIVTLLASLSGIWNALGWIPVGLNLAFVLAYSYFLFAKTA